MRRVATFLASSLMAAACTSTAQVATAPEGSASGPAAPSTAPGSPAAADGTPVGGTVVLRGSDGSDTADVTAVRIVDPAWPKDQFVSPAPGMRYVAVQFRLRNTGTEPFNDTPGSGAQLIDTTGQRFSSTYADTAAGPSFTGSVAIAPGDTALGYVAFEIPLTSKVAKVQFALDNGFSDDLGQWTPA
ncbi:DUF4352 domain-containing protein [Streptomyces sp. TLI_171]|uniref:DUF4352 domain-containing protein n=1 Tax=Streptomyces sp. TLI_171 TaxID=1938859 RepID=UPI000C3E7D06|nr:DUF4352 domain-containing protein [Streptomyces sp. TLI_171]RKE17409.1 uncharacterized protein DUF4352 [Streptomyces sp. TLI_171]